MASSPLNPPAAAPLAGTSDWVRSPQAAAGFLGAVLLWCYWPTLMTMADRWSRDPQYSHGFLVPVFALVVLFHRREWLLKARWQPSLWGLPLLGAGLALRLAAARMDIEPLDAFSLVPSLFGLVLFVGGLSVLRWSWPALAFLAFMLPLPFTIETALAQPLRRLATNMSTYALQTIGYPALAEGNIIVIETVQLGVADACSGLGMLMTFFALSTALALVVKAPLLDRWLLVASAIPIAVIANVARITATAMAYHGFGSAAARDFTHDLSGWLMMPLALGLLWLELWFLRKLLVPTDDSSTRPLAIAGLGKSTFSETSR